MSQLERLQEEKKSKAISKKPRKANGADTRFVSFHPTTEERKAIREDLTPLREVLDFLLTWVEDGHRLTFGHKGENSAYYVMLREGGAGYDEAVTLSVWHEDPWICVYALKAALKGRYGAFPNIQLNVWEDVDW